MIVVVGAGMAGLQTVVALRAQGYAGPLTLVGAEPEAPYDRPPLSKQVLAGETDSSTLDADWPELDVDLRLGTAATEIGDGVLGTDHGDIAFDRAVLTTGALPRRLPGAERALTLRTRADSLRLRTALRPGRRLTIVGAGWIGAEVATAAVARGVDVTVVEGLAEPLASALPLDVGARMRSWWSSVDLRLGEQVDAVEDGAVHLVGGGRVAADVVLLGIGASPVALPGVDRSPSGAVAVDAQLRTSRTGVFAAGDCAAWESARYASTMHVEHWDNALHAPAVAAANVLGGSQVWDPVPYFWSEQWGRMVQYAGHHPVADRTVRRDDGERWAVFWLAGERLVAALAVDRPRDLVQSRHLMQRDAAVDADVLMDPAAPVKSAAT